MALSEVKLKIGKEAFVLKATNRALFEAMRDLGCDNKLSKLLNMIDELDLLAIFTLFKYFAKDERSVEDLMDLEVSAVEVGNMVGNALSQGLGLKK